MEFRKMRRDGQALTPAQCRAVLARGTSGVLAVAGDGGYPYAVPLSYAWQEDRLVFHCAKAGHKLDAIIREPKASFCVIDQDQVVPEEYTTYFRSVIVFGRVRVVEDESQLRAAAALLGRKYAPEHTSEQLEQAITQSLPRLCVLELIPDCISGKEAVELSRAGQGPANPV